MTVAFDIEKRRLAWVLVILAVVIPMWYLVEFPLWMLFGFLVIYFGVKCVEIHLEKGYAVAYEIALLLLGPWLSIFLVQYLLLDAELFQKTTREKWILNIACALVVYLFFLLCTARVRISFLISHLFFLLVGFIDFYVYEFRQNEFTFADIRSIGTGLSVAGNYTFFMPLRGAHVILLSILVLAFIRSVKLEEEHYGIIRGMAGLVGVLCVIYVAFHSTEINTETWEKKGTYRNGYVYNFVLSIRDSFVSAPEGYSKLAVRSLEKEYPGDTSSIEKKPTIIAIMNESFSDLSVLGELKTNIPLTPYLDSLKDNTSKGYALSSVFGAKTPNSEWEFLTGNSMAFLPSGSVVYQQYIGEEPSSLVSTLKNYGYTCVAMHPYYETGWSRNQIYPTMGYDEMYFIDDFDNTQIIREYITDEEMYRKLIERYEQSSSNEDLFIFGITMQNHGGYTTTYDNFREDVYKTGHSYTDANQYLSLVHESDIALKGLIDYFSKVEEPVEILFFGDHQPSLTHQFYKIMNGIGLSNLDMEDLEHLYTVPFFIWTNYESTEEEIPITSLNYLSTLLLEKAKLPLPAYNQFLSDLRQEIPAINSRGYYSKTAGGYLHLEDALGEEKKWMNQYEILQYNGMFDHKNKSKSFFPYLN